MAGIEDAKAIAAGAYHSCALHQNGTISCWGYNYNGQLGNGQSGEDADTSEPVEVAGIEDAKAIAAGFSHSCALHQNGTVSCWGENTYGQLGNGQSGYESLEPIEEYNIGSPPQEIESSVPVKVEGIEDAKAIAAGGNWDRGHSCALHQDGSISCWGDNTFGQLGNGQSGFDWNDRSIYSSVPVSVADITDATALAVGFHHSCALREDGTISCWGHNVSNRPGSIADSSVPVEVLEITDATALTAGFKHSCALHQDGTISCWGDNTSGQLGNGLSGPNTYSPDSATPVKVAGITDAATINAGGNLNRGHSCALHQDGTISCWGDNTYGQLGNGSEDNFSKPAKVVGMTDATAITAGLRYSCALRPTGTISCWGSNYYGQLGNGQSGPNTDSTTPVEVEGITDATAISPGWQHSCALHEDGTISCWGPNWSGELGNGTESSLSLPVGVVGITDAKAIAVGYLHSCALHEDGTISCWGDNKYGQLGNGSEVDSAVPVQVADITDATAITTGTDYSCALHQTGTISCWGDNEYGHLGNGSEVDSAVPVQVADITDATAIVAGYRHSCALFQDGTISCWGPNWSGELGNGTESSPLLPVGVVGITDATAITAGSEHSCALHQNGTISCWGSNWQGQLGNGNENYYNSDSSSSVPVEVIGITDATAITAGYRHSCALHEDGTISCWGDNKYGQLGDGPRLPQFVVGFGG